MKESITRKLAHFFNEGNLDELVKLWHDDIKAYDLKTNELLVPSKRDLIQADKPYVLDENVVFKVNNVVVYDDVEIGHTSFDAFNLSQVQVFEVRNGLITKIFITRIMNPSNN